MNNLDSELRELIANALECDVNSIKPDSGLGKHFNWDSLGHVAVMVALEDKYGIEINDRNIESLSNFTAIKEYVKKNTNFDLVTVIMPAYNPDKRLMKKAIASVFSQTYPNIELVIGDDGSQIAIEDYLDLLISDLNNPNNVKVKIIRNSNNHGISSARNTAINNSLGKWLVWLDSDDSLQDDCIKNLMDESDLFDLVIGECIVYDDNTISRRKPKSLFSLAKEYYGTEKDPFLLNIISIQPQLILKSELMDIGAFNEHFHYAELTELFLRYISIKGLDKVNFIENAVYNYYRNRENSHSTNRKELFRYRLEALTNYKNFLKISSADLEYVERDSLTGFQKYKLKII